ncbi:MAG TPA: response regulator transcription factor [Terriglobales bacterium]|nr:response regulator transcription factor [Terriglobales bacterium]
MPNLIFGQKVKRLCRFRILTTPKTMNMTPPYRILIVDDNDTFRQSVGALLASHDGWVVCGQANDGIQAVEHAKLLRPDLIIMDISMPNMNGIDASKIIRTEVCESRILILSQNDPAIVRRQTLEADAHGFLTKAELFQDLIGTVERILSVDGQRQSGKAS